MFHFNLLTSDQTMYHNVTFQPGVASSSSSSSSSFFFFFFFFFSLSPFFFFFFWGGGGGVRGWLLLLFSSLTKYGVSLNSAHIRSNSVPQCFSQVCFCFVFLTKYSVSLNSAHVTSNNVAWGCISVKCTWRFCTIKVLCSADHLIPLTSHQTV